jgi:hypothetical protein
MIQANGHSAYRAPLTEGEKARRHSALVQSRSGNVSSLAPAATEVADDLALTPEQRAARTDFYGGGGLASIERTKRGQSMGKHETGYARQDRDFYPTPAWPIEALAEQVDLRGNLVGRDMTSKPKKYLGISTFAPSSVWASARGRHSGPKISGGECD